MWGAGPVGEVKNLIFNAKYSQPAKTVRRSDKDPADIQVLKCAMTVILIDETGPTETHVKSVPSLTSE